MNLHAPKGIDVENWFIECYRKHKGHPLKILIGLYKGNYNKFFLAVLFFFIKHAPVWVLPIVTANIINDITRKNSWAFRSKRKRKNHFFEINKWFAHTKFRRTFYWRGASRCYY